MIILINRKLVTWLLLTLVFLQSCQKDNIPTNFQNYVDSFIAEGAKRGRKLHTDNLVIKFNPDKNGASQCVAGSPTVLINKDFFEIYDDLQRESEVFHELGHCILGLKHNNCQLPDGTSTSIMCGIGGSCITDYCFSPYGGMRREYYLDQLFETNPPIPQWAKLDEFKDEYLNKQRSLTASEDFNDISSISFGDDKYSSEVSFGKLNMDGKSTIRLNRISKTNVSQENVEIETSFQIIGNEGDFIAFYWNPLNSNATYFNSYSFAITNKKEGVILELAINNRAGYKNNVDKYIKLNGYNQLLLRKVGNMFYFYLNSHIFLIQDFVNVSLETIKLNGQDTTGEFFLRTSGKCSFDYVKVNKIVL